MASRTILSNTVLVPASAVFVSVSVTIGVCRWAFSNLTDVATLRVQVQAIDARVVKAESRLDKGDERWDQIRDDLGKIKERLGIVESHGPAKQEK